MQSGLHAVYRQRGSVPPSLVGEGVGGRTGPLRPRRRRERPSGKRRRAAQLQVRHELTEVGALVRMAVRRKRARFERAAAEHDRERRLDVFEDTK